MEDEEIIGKFTILKMSYTLPTGETTTVEQSFSGVTLYDLMTQIGMCVKAFGFSEEGIREFIPDC